ncbi:PDR/VanB family oxidoreductase [Pseudomonas fluorescens]|uniref:Oxidoreductase n=1 Tax=Pseudomonas fluorescens TaxID=294 RepID=A0A423LFX4_PSEFL|nr:PDR/VanB family oxidoreductase [Pseudomonas fluorescens]RON67178.1 oxidoreductase [Pseudomonas fluorescens]
MQVKIVRKFEVATDICAFELAHPDGAGLPAFFAGAHIDVHLEDGIVRQYSLCNSSSDTRRYLIAVLRDPNSRGGSLAMHRLEEGQLLEIGEPKNHFPLSTEAEHSILLAGGIGVTPILSMAETLAAEGASFEVHYCARDTSRMAFRERFGDGQFTKSTHLYFDDAGPESRIDLATLLAKPMPGKHLYVCGPGGFIMAVLAAAKAAGWDDHCIHREFFAAASSPQTIDPRTFQVKLSSDGRVLDIPHDKTVLQVLLAEGLEIPTSCKEGVCGMCLTRVLSGEPDHNDFYLSDDEKAANNQFLPCCSRSKSPLLVLDI